MGTSRPLIGREAGGRGPPAHPAGGRFPEGFFANNKVILFAKRSLRGPPAHWPGWRPPAHWSGGMPASGTSSRIRNFSYSRRGPREGPGNFFGNLPPVGWAGGPRPHASHPINGREVPIFRIFPIRLPFFEF
jgi:hypothetical protein